MAHFVRRQNLPFSIEDIKQMSASCPVCAELKPRFYGADPGKLIKATSPFERLNNIDFKGPFLTETNNRYILTVVDEYSRFPFAFPCSDMTSSTVVKCLSELFAMFGKPSYIHSDRGPCFMSDELKQFLHEHGIATLVERRVTTHKVMDRWNGITELFGKP